MRLNHHWLREPQLESAKEMQSATGPVHCCPAPHAVINTATKGVPRGYKMPSCQNGTLSHSLSMDVKKCTKCGAGANWALYFDRAPRELIWPCLWLRKLPETYVQTTTDTYESSTMVVRSNCSYRDPFTVRVGLQYTQAQPEAYSYL